MAPSLATARTAARKKTRKSRHSKVFLFCTEFLCFFSWERFTVHVVAPGIIALQRTDNKRYCK